MSTRKKESDPSPKKAVKTASRAKTSARKASAPVATSGEPSSKNLLTAGIKALSDAHDEVVARQKGVFESLLGFGKAPASSQGEARPSLSNPLASAALDPFGFRKFEDVFDQRVARTLQRLGMPSVEDVEALRREVDALRSEVAALRGLKR